MAARLFSSARSRAVAWPWTGASTDAIVVGALTLTAFLLRLPGQTESLFGDELYTFAIATQGGPDAVYDAMQRTENNPPLFYALAWGFRHVGDPTVSIRLPSFILGTATIPLTYALGRRTFDRGPALLAAALLTLSPFAIFYAEEARAYATLGFLVTLSTFLLLVALEGSDRRWLVAYAVAAVLVVYTHYTGFFAVAGQALWAISVHRRQLVALVLTYGAVALAFLPWLPSYFGQKPFGGYEVIGGPRWTVEESIRSYLISFVGHPFTPLATVPGRLAVALLGVAVAAGLIGWVGSRVQPSAGAGLVAVVALATPLALILYSAVGTNIFGPRNLSASLPVLCLLLGALLRPPNRGVAACATVAAVAAVGIGTVRSLDADRDRPPFKEAAHAIDAQDRGDVAVIEYPLFGPSGPLGRSLELNFERPHDLRKTRLDDPALGGALAGHRAVYVVAPWVPPWRATPLPPALARRFDLVRKRVWPSWIPVALLEYRRAN